MFELTAVAPQSQPLDERDLETLARIAAAETTHTIELALDAARERLAMDAAYVTTHTPGIQSIDQVSGDSSALGFGAGTVVPIEQTYCHRMLKGELPNVVPDTRSDPAARELGASGLIGAYAGVPITLADGRVHGTLCCVSSQPRADLGAEEVEFMRVLAKMVGARINEIESDQAAAVDKG